MLALRRGSSCNTGMKVTTARRASLANRAGRTRVISSYEADEVVDYERFNHGGWNGKPILVLSYRWSQVRGSTVTKFHGLAHKSSFTLAGRPLRL